MVSLVPLTESEFEAYLEVSIREYAQEHVKAGNFKPETALEQAQKQLERILPDGFSTEGHFFNSIEDDSDQTKVGILWYAIDDQGRGKRVFVYDIVIFEEYRRQGYGLKTFKLLEDVVRKLGLAEISLHVFGHNQLARKMYKKLGFIETDLILSKKLSVRAVSLFPRRQ